MPNLEVELNDKGEIVKLPDQLQKLMDERIDAAFGKGAEKAAKEAKKQMDEAIAKARDEEREKVKGTVDPAAIEKVKNLEIELSKRKEEEAVQTKNFAEAQKLRDERHANELKEREEKVKAKDAEIEKRTARIRELVTAEIRVEAIKAGARNESLPELDVLLSSRVGLDDNLQAFVKDAEGKPALDKDQKPVSIEGLVTQYLTDHPHHKAAVKGTGGRAPGGQSLTGQPKSKNPEADAALEQVAADPSIANATDYIAKTLLAGAGASR